MKKNVCLIVSSIFVVCVLSIMFSSCNSEDLNEIPSNQKQEKVVVEENSHALSESEALAESQEFSQNRVVKLSSKKAAYLRSLQLDSRNETIKIVNMTVSLLRESSSSMMVVQKIPVYIVNYKNGAGKASGYTVLVGDDRFSEKVVAFNDEGECNLFENEDADFWKEQISGYIYDVVNSKPESSIMKLESKVQSANYFIRLNWRTRYHQYGPPYADYTPFRKGARASAGCTATAMAEIMTYHEWPRQGAYQRYKNEKQLETVQTKYPQSSWDLVRKNEEHLFDPLENPIARDHIANLFAEIAYKLNTNFVSPTAAYAFPSDVPAVFRQMGYRTSNLQWHSSDTSTFSREIIKDVYEKRRPVFMCGWKKSGGGHAFVIMGVVYSVNGAGAKHLSYIYIRNGTAGNDDNWYLADMFRRPNVVGHIPYPYRYNCAIISGIERDNNNIGSTSLYRVSSINDY